MAEHPKPNLELLYSQLVSIYSKKESSQHDWSEPLSKAQFNYAAKDAIMSYQLGMAIVFPSLELIRGKCDTVNEPLLLNYQDKCIETDVEDAASQDNPIGRLQEFAQRHGLCLPSYEFTGANGQFGCTCTLKGFDVIGKGRSKKEAKANSAKEMLKIFDL